MMSFHTLAFLFTILTTPAMQFFAAEQTKPCPCSGAGRQQKRMSGEQEKLQLLYLDIGQF